MGRVLLPPMAEVSNAAWSHPSNAAIAEAVAERLGKRQGAGHHADKHGNISGFEKGETRDLAAAKAGLGSGKRSSPDKPTPSKPLLQKT